MQKQSENQKWLINIQKQFAKLISSPYWDCIHIPDSYINIITLIMNTKNVTSLSPLINERLTDTILNTCKQKIKQAKKNCNHEEII